MQGPSSLPGTVLGEEPQSNSLTGPRPKAAAPGAEPGLVGGPGWFVSSSSSPAPHRGAGKEAGTAGEATEIGASSIFKEQRGKIYEEVHLKVRSGTL